MRKTEIARLNAIVVPKILVNVIHRLSFREGSSINTVTSINAATEVADQVIRTQR